MGKSYAQASKLSSNTEEVLKIKENFPSLKVNSINNIQKIIKDNGKPKLHIKMTTKSPLRKHVIVSVNNDNKKNFMEECSNHVTNINRALKNIKLEVLIDFIWPDPKGIIIVTNKVTSPLDLQTIENYMKNANPINVNGVEVLRLSQPKFYLKIIDIPMSFRVRCVNGMTMSE